MRYLVSYHTHLVLGQNFPYGTLIVNVTGSFLAGLLAILILDRVANLAPQLTTFRLFLITTISDKILSPFIEPLQDAYFSCIYTLGYLHAFSIRQPGVPANPRPERGAILR